MELGAVLQYAGEHGPYLVVLALILRSSAKKDAIIESLTHQALQMAQATQTVSRIAAETIKRTDV